MFFKKNKIRGNSKMDLFANKKQELKETENKIKELKKDVKHVEEPYRLEPEVEEPEQPTQMDKATAKVGFKIIVRQLHDIETQIKSGKPTDVDELKRDKMPTINFMVNQAEATKLKIKEYIDAFTNAGYSEEDIQKLKNDALEGKKNYVYFTV